MVKSDAETSSPSAPATWSLNDRIVLSMPAPRIVTPSTRASGCDRSENVPAGISITSPGLASSNRFCSVVSSNGAGASVVGAVVLAGVLVVSGAGASVVGAVVSAVSPVVSSGAAGSSDVVGDVAESSSPPHEATTSALESNMAEIRRI